MSIFSKDGRLLIPLKERKAYEPKTKQEKVRYVISEAYCPKGCNIIDSETKIHGYPGLRIKFKRKGTEGEFIISAIEGDFDKIIVSGKLENGVKDELFCPHCGTPFAKLVNCNCQTGAEMVVLGLTPQLDFNNAITFCNVTGCKNGTFVDSGVIIRHLRLDAESFNAH
jgi:hypothetical protein